MTEQIKPESQNLETMAVKANLSNVEREYFDKLKAELLQILGGKTFEDIEKTQDLVLARRVNKKMAEILEFLKSPEMREINSELKEQLEYWSDFYSRNEIDWVSLPDEISVSAEQSVEMKRLMELGFDKIIIIPEGFVDEPEIIEVDGEKQISNPKYEKLHKLMSAGYVATATDNAYNNDGKFQGSKDKRSGLRIILTKDIQELFEDELLKKTVGKSVEELESDEELNKFSGLTESEYLIYQREYFQRTGKHLDCNYGSIWLKESGRPLSGRVPYAFWSGSFLRFDSLGRSNRGGALGCRLAGSFQV